MVLAYSFWRLWLPNEVYFKELVIRKRRGNRSRQQDKIENWGIKWLQKEEFIYLGEVQLQQRTSHLYHVSCSGQSEPSRAPQGLIVYGQPGPGPTKDALAYIYLISKWFSPLVEKNKVIISVLLKLTWRRPSALPPCSTLMIAWCNSVFLS